MSATHNSTHKQTSRSFHQRSHIALFIKLAPGGPTSTSRNIAHFPESLEIMEKAHVWWNILQAKGIENITLRLAIQGRP